MPSLALIFLMVLCWSKLIQLINFTLSLLYALQTNPELGSHTNVFHFSIDYLSGLSQTHLRCHKYIWWNVASMDGSWAVECENLKCSMDKDNHQVVSSAKLSKHKPQHPTFITPRKKLQGWMVEVVLNQEISI
ncbi:hypothetical protein V8B97DRAFT_2022192 [Scleroderma yunnanense]